MKKAFILLLLSLLFNNVFAQIITKNNQRVFVKNKDVLFFYTNKALYTQLKWTFDGADFPISSEQNPIVNYSKEGKYDVKLVVYNNKDSVVYFLPNYIIIAENSLAPSKTVTRQNTNDTSVGADIFEIRVNNTSLITSTISQDVQNGIADTHGYIDSTNSIIAYVSPTQDSMEYFVETYAIQPTVKGNSIAIFIDVNNDGELNYINENVISYVGSSTTKTWKGRFKIPSNCVKNKIIRLRVTSDFGSYPLSNSVVYGNGEDIGLYIDSPVISNVETVKNTETIVYPQPATNQLHIQNPQGNLVQLISIHGKILLSKSFVSKSKKIELNVSDFENGVYVLKFNNGYTQKVIIE